MIAQHDEIVIKSYRITATSIESFGAAILAEADAAGKKVRLAIDTMPNDSAVSFYMTSSVIMEAILSSVRTAVSAAHKSFAGISVHDISNWVLLPLV